MIKIPAVHIVALSILAAGTPIRAAESFAETLHRETRDFQQRQTKAADTLTAARIRIAQEKAPLLRELRALEDRIILAQAETRRLETDQEQSASRRRALVRQIDDLARTSGYLNTLAHDGLRAAGDGLAPGEAKLVTPPLESMLAALDAAVAENRARTAVDAAGLLLAQTEQSLGGYVAPGRSLFAGDNELYAGTFAFVGPETFFRADSGRTYGSVRLRTGGSLPTTHAIAGWRLADAEAFFAGATGVIPLDASGGKALRLAETKGSVWAHVRKGGTVAFAILAAGVLAVLLVGQKIRDLLSMGVATPAETDCVLRAVAAGEWAAAERALASRDGGTARLLTTGLEHRGDPKATREEALQSILLELRLRFERRLPLLAVIATASPLMGLLGTVVGMIRTFALITVFGTGNAGKLSSGISEVLVATELGLVVAIPTLIAHGFLAHRIHKNLATLERFAVDLITALDVAAMRTARPEGTPTPVA
ncbi:MAG TPA: MotA/TolQ/ExbB proton channel family protein [Opitutaceae bacterium]|nr:MotA/TolQ/ExbB proton channel family protein [Opitutaceae bacterium]